MSDNAFPVGPAQHLTDQQRERISDDLVAYVRAHPHRQTLRRRRIRVGVLAAAVLGLGVGGTAAAVGILSPAPVTDHDIARCYQEISTNFGDDFPGAQIAEALASTGSTDGQVYAPLDACAALWREGALPIRNPFTDPPTNAPYPVPNLVGCVLPDGTAAVFPGDPTTCNSLSLPPALPG